MNEASSSRLNEPEQNNDTLPFFKALKVISDIFQPNIPTECYGVYSILARRDNLTSNPNNSIRALATAANVSTATVSRSLDMLIHLALVKRVRCGGSQPDRYELLNAWEAAEKWGAVYVRKSVWF
jgi:replication initiation and membrane attachment protein DnaB